MWSSFFQWLGILCFINYLYASLKSPAQLLYHRWLQYQKKDIPLTEKYGKWAAITGSTDGIGKVYARQLARLGFNVMLISRNLHKLKQVAAEIENEFGVEVFVVQADFSEGSQIYGKLFQDMAAKPIGLLVNNVGIGHNPPGMVFTFTAEHVWHMINVNIGAATQLSRHYIDLWYRSGTKGCIVNVSSGLEAQPFVYASVYAATKAFIRSFTITIQEEAAPFGITVQLLSPNFVSTKINCYSKSLLKGNLLVPQVDEYAKWAVSTLGKVDITSGYYWHGIQNSVTSILPIWLRLRLAKYVIRMITDDRSNMIRRPVAESNRKPQF